MLADSWVTPAGRIYFRRVGYAGSFWSGELEAVARGESGDLRFDGARHGEDGRQRPHLRNPRVRHPGEIGREIRRAWTEHSGSIGGVSVVGAHQSGDQNGEVENAQDGFEDGNGACLPRDWCDARGAEGGYGAETVINEIEVVGSDMKVGVRIEIEGVRLEGGYHSVGAGKTKSHQEVDAKGPENGLGVRAFVGEDTVEKYHDDDEVKEKAQGDVE